MWDRRWGGKSKKEGVESKFGMSFRISIYTSIFTPLCIISKKAKKKHYKTLRLIKNVKMIFFVPMATAYVQRSLTQF